MKAYVYLRVSTNSQVVSGLGLEAQEAACRAYIARKPDWTYISTCRDEGISGADDLDARPGLRALTALTARRRDATIVVYSLSRLSRRQSLTWALLDERGEYALQIASATENFENVTPSGRAMLGMIAVFASLERDLCAERTRAALAAKRQRGEALGMRPLSEETAAHVRALYATGEYLTYSALARHLTASGVPTRHGRRWHASTVARLVAQ